MSIFKVYCPYVCVCVCIISELHSVEWQSKLPTHLQYGRFFFINNTHRRVFTWRHLEAWQYVTQSGLHLHQSKPHSCKDNKKNGCQELIYYEHFRDILISVDARKQAYLASGIHQKRKITACKRPDSFSRICFSKVVEYKKFPWIFLDEGITWMFLFGYLIP